MVAAAVAAPVKDKVPNLSNVEFENGLWTLSSNVAGEGEGEGVGGGPLVLALDTETTGVNPHSDHITELSFVLYDFSAGLNGDGQVTRAFSSLVFLPHGVEVPHNVASITGISTAMCRLEGRPIEYALVSLFDAVCAADVVVAHNLRFDRGMIEREIERVLERGPPAPNLSTATAFASTVCESSSFWNRASPSVWRALFSKSLNAANGRRLVCTMELAKAQHGKEFLDKLGRRKNPRLDELHHVLFREPMQGQAHRALADTLACLRCYLTLLQRGEVEGGKKTTTTTTTTTTSVKITTAAKTVMASIAVKVQKVDRGEAAAVTAVFNEMESAKRKMPDFSMFCHTE